MKLETRPEQRTPFTAEELKAGDEAAWQQLLGAIVACKGNVSHAAVALGVSPRALFRWAERFERLRAAIAVIRPPGIVTQAQLKAGDEAAWQQLLNLVAATHGNVAHLAERLEAPLRTVQHWQKRYPRLAAAIETARAAGTGVAARLDEAGPTDVLQLKHDGESYVATRGEQTGRGLTPTLAVWDLS